MKKKSNTFWLLLIIFVGFCCTIMIALVNHKNNHETKKSIPEVVAAVEKYDSFNSSEVKEIDESQPLLSEIYGRVAIFDDPFITNPTPMFKTLLGTVDGSHIDSYEEIEDFSVRDTVVIHSSYESLNLIKFYNDAVSSIDVKPDWVILLEDESTHENSQELEELLRMYTSICSKAGVSIRVLYSDGVERTYYYYVE